jgi:rubrerythrin
MEISEPTRFEKEFGIDLSSPNPNVIRGIDIGIEIEKRGIQFYSEQAQRIQNTIIKDLFEFLAEQERDHLNTLSGLKNSLIEKKQWIDIEHEQIRKPKELFEEGESSEMDVILTAMRTEKDTSDFYMRMSQIMDDDKGKKFFMKLAEWENIHYDTLNAIFEQSNEFRMES